MRTLWFSVITVILLAGSTFAAAAQSQEDPTAGPPIPSVGCGAPGVAIGTQTGLDITVGDKSERFSMHAPAAHDGVIPIPLWVQLHGAGGSGSQQVGMIYGDADEHGFVVAAPQSYFGSAGWTWREDDPELDRSMSNPDIALVVALIDRLSEELCLDLARVYVAGYSGGGEGAAVLACVLEDRVAAVAPVAAIQPSSLALACLPTAIEYPRRHAFGSPYEHDK